MNKAPSLNIGIIHPGRFPWNRGIGQLYGLLKDLGHDPKVFSRAIEKRFLGENYKEFKFKIMRQGNSILNRIKTYPTAINPLWQRFILECAKDIEADCLFLRETNLLKQAVSAAKELKIPIFLDMRENLGLLFSTTRTKRGINFLRTESFINFVEKIWLKDCSHIFTVTEELKEWLVKKYGIPAKTISVLGNYPDRNYIKMAKQIDVAGKRTFGAPVKFAYAGDLSEGKGLQDIIRSLAIVQRKYDCTLTVFGEGNYRRNLADLALAHGLEQKVIFQPLLPPDELLPTLAEFDIGLCPYLINKFSNQTMPGKLFEYMCVGLPVLSSSRRTVSRVIEEIGCGVIYASREPREIAAKMTGMIDNMGETLGMGLKGRKAVLSKYNNETSKKVVEKVLEEHFNR